jgi:hypothetical protein
MATNEELHQFKVGAKPSDCEERRSTLDFESICKTDSRFHPSVVAVLVSLLQSSHENHQSILDAVEGINDQLYPKRDDPEDFLWTFWALLFTIARRVPYNHRKQELLVDFLISLSRKATGTTNIWGVCVPYFLSPHRIIPIIHLLFVCYSTLRRG